jgi:hypothetical protein
VQASLVRLGKLALSLEQHARVVMTAAEQAQSSQRAGLCGEDSIR